jgi:hypothetical protein
LPVSLGLRGSFAPDFNAVIAIKANQGRLRSPISRRFAQFQEQYLPLRPTAEDLEVGVTTAAGGSKK